MIPLVLATLNLDSLQDKFSSLDEIISKNVDTLPKKKETTLSWGDNATQQATNYGGIII